MIRYASEPGRDFPLPEGIYGIMTMKNFWVKLLIAVYSIFHLNVFFELVYT